MRRDPGIINLYDRPLYSRRSRVSHRDDPAGFGTNLLVCTAIVALTGGFFWLYDAVAHRQPPFVPALTQPAVASANRWGPPTAIPARGLNAPTAPSHTATTAAKHDDTAQRPTKTAEAPRKIKKVRAVKRIPEEAKQAFAFGFGFSRPPE